MQIKLFGYVITVNRIKEEQREELLPDYVIAIPSVMGSYITMSPYTSQLDFLLRQTPVHSNSLILEIKGVLVRDWLVLYQWSERDGKWVEAIQQRKPRATTEGA